MNNIHSNQSNQSKNKTWHQHIATKAVTLTLMLSQIVVEMDL